MNSGETLLHGDGVHLCGHRGHSIDGAENCRRSIQQAAALGATMCEIDLRLTSDDCFVVFHDPILDFSSTGSGPVRDRPLAEVTSLRHKRRCSDNAIGGSAAEGSETISGLEEILEIASRCRIGLVIELKDQGVSDRLVDQLIHIIRGTPVWGSWLLSSFDHCFLAEQKLRQRDLSTFGIFHSRHTDVVAIANSAMIDVYSVDYPRLYASDAKSLAQAKVGVASFLPKPLLFELGGDVHTGGLEETLVAAKSGDLQILGTDDVSWGAKLLSKHQIRAAPQPIAC